jgi:hypothetical protein
MHRPVAAIVAAFFAIASAGSASAHVVIVSRTSTLHAYRSDPNPALAYDETATSHGLGSITLSTPHGGTFSSTVSDTGMGGSFSGDLYRPGGGWPVITGRVNSLEVVFEIVGTAAEVSISMNGVSIPPGNVVTRLTNLAGTVEHFNADWIAVHDGKNGWDPDVWPSVTWNGVLSAGMYRLYAAAGGFVAYGPGGGQPQSGGGSFSLGVTIVPAPHAGALLVMAGVVGRRRRPA